MKKESILDKDIKLKDEMLVGLQISQFEERTLIK
jgi:hypothetical protein